MSQNYSTCKRLGGLITLVILFMKENYLKNLKFKT